jgi:hypothetical protein
MLTAPSDAPSAPDISYTGASHTSGIGVSRGATASRGELVGTMARSPVLTVDGATKGKYEDVTGHAVGRQTIRADEV